MVLDPRADIGSVLRRGVRRRKRVDVKIARVLLKSIGRPRIALERDGALYDVEILERALSANGEPQGSSGKVGELWDPSDFQTRVSTLRCAGLYDLDMRLIQGLRPTSSRLDEADVMRLAPCDTERATYVHVDARPLRAGAKPVCRIGQARALSGQGALIAIPDGESSPGFEISLAAVIGDDVARATAHEAATAIMGLTIVIDWVAQTVDARPFAALSSTRGLCAQVGPTLVSRFALPKPGNASVSVSFRGEKHSVGPISEIGLSIEEAIAFASGEVELRAGDLIAVGPLPRGSAAALGRTLALHEEVEVEVEGIGTLRGVAVPRRPHESWPNV